MRRLISIKNFTLESGITAILGAELIKRIKIKNTVILLAKLFEQLTKRCPMAQGDLPICSAATTTSQ